MLKKHNFKILKIQTRLFQILRISKKIITCKWSVMYITYKTKL